MSVITPSLIRSCANCGAELPLDALACPQCSALVHGDRLDQLARDARALEQRGSFRQASELWEYSLTLLPQGSKQVSWVQERLRALEAAQNPPPPPDPAAKKQPTARQAKWMKRLGPFGPLVLLLAKIKSLLFVLLKLKFLFSFLLFIGLYVSLFGWRFGLGISAAILIHEMGHYIDVKRRGLPAEMPVFLPGLGAYVRWTSMGVTRKQIAQISLAGPLAGWIAAAVCFLIYAQTRDPLWAALARTGAVLNVLNLIPVWVLDGGQATHSLGAMERGVLMVMCVALWFYSGETIFLFAAAGFVWRLFTRDRPQEQDWSTWAYYAALLVALAVLLHAMPANLVQIANQ
ncbi:site-2 protease family protein [Acidicapsa dinghuensis]|uniref:Site-2 protease family protein n=1 Tax=Acidicapsa dinghuensis TaxID=2218256 RepID=A0ABW1EM72_9BACT|nr:site-2 protease family protein [Acidicapsa dinghuensis]